MAVRGVPYATLAETHRVFEECGRNQVAAAKKLGIARQTLQSRLAAFADHQEQKRTPGGDAARLVAFLKRDPRSLEQIAEEFDVTRAAAGRLVKAAVAAGMNIHEFSGIFSVEARPSPQSARGTIPIYRSRPDGTYLFGFTGDNHLASRYERLDVLNDLYDQFAVQGVDRVFNAGNWIDGEAPFNKFDLHTHGMDAQIDYLAKHYPQRPGIETHAIAGDDHEGWYAQRHGVDIGRYAANRMRERGRSDWFDHGYMEAYFRLVHAGSGKSTMLHLMHPGGGTAYAVSYTVQKICEGYDGGEKPAVLLAGHYHKLSYNMIRNVHAIQTGCFTSSTQIETRAGRKRISSIKVGDEVLTHAGRYMPVTKLFSRHHSGDMASLNFGRRGRPDQTVTATPEHPVLVDRGGALREWVPISEVVAGDIVFVRSTICPITGELMPYWMRLSKMASPVDDPAVREKIRASKGGAKARVRGGSDGATHMVRDVLPFCRDMQAKGWRMVPVGAGVIPDAIGFRNGEVVAFEVERSKGAALAHKKAKYSGTAVAAAVDRVEWVDCAPRKEQPRAWYEVDEATGFCKVRVLSVGRHALKRTVRVYNFEVAEDNSYVAGNVVVHNCTEDQTPFMRKKKIPAHVGGGICQLRQDANTGAITACRVEFFNYFVQGFYNGRWNKAESPVLARRK